MTDSIRGEEVGVIFQEGMVDGEEDPECGQEAVRCGDFVCRVD